MLAVSQTVVASHAALRTPSDTRRRQRQLPPRSWPLCHLGVRCVAAPDLDITYLKSQIWYSPWLTEAEKRTNSIWSLRFSVDVRHHRLPEEINVRLFPIK